MSLILQACTRSGAQIGIYVIHSIKNAKFTVVAYGSITDPQAIYNPDPKQPVTFHAYYPYNNSVTNATKLPFTVIKNIKQSDFGYAQVEALQSKEAQKWKFSHLLRGR